MAGDLAGGHAGGRRYAFYFPFAFKLLDTSVDLSGIMVVTGNRLCIYPLPLSKKRTLVRCMYGTLCIQISNRSS